MALTFSARIDRRSIMLPAVSLFSRAPAGTVDSGASAARRGLVHQLQRHQQQFVHTFGGIVAGLVVAVDGALVGRDLGVGHRGAACQVFLGPQQAVVSVVGLHPLPQRRAGRRRRAAASHRPPAGGRAGR
jgi:hypothetical protein